MKKKEYKQLEIEVMDEFEDIITGSNVTGSNDPEPAPTPDAYDTPVVW